MPHLVMALKIPLCSPKRGADAKCRSDGKDGGRRLPHRKPRGKGGGKKQQQRTAQKPKQKQNTKANGKNAAYRAPPPGCQCAGDHQRERTRHPRDGQHKKQRIQVVGGKKIRHSLHPDDADKRELVKKPHAFCKQGGRQ